jgi:transcriptional regulator
MSPRERNQLLHGTLDTLILKVLSYGPRHGYAVARWLEEETDEALSIEEGSLYPALYRLEKKGLVRSEWGVSELERRAKFYQLTERGRAHLEEETQAWEAFSGAVTRVLRPRGA